MLPLTKFIFGTSPIILNLDSSCRNGPLILCNNFSNLESSSDFLAIQYTLTNR